MGAVAQPGKRGAAVRIDGREVVTLLVKERKSVNQCKILSHIVCTILERPNMENLLSVSNPYTAIFHRSRIAGTCTVNGNAILPDFRDGVIVNRRGSVREYFTDGTYIFLRISAISINGGSLGIKGFVTCALEAVYLELAFFPGIENTGIPAGPDGVVLLAWSAHDS